MMAIHLKRLKCIGIVTKKYRKYLLLKVIFHLILARKKRIVLSIIEFLNIKKHSIPLMAVSVRQRRSDFVVSRSSRVNGCGRVHVLEAVQKLIKVYGQERAEEIKGEAVEGI